MSGSGVRVNQSLRSRAPSGVGRTDNKFGPRKYTGGAGNATTTSHADPVPDDWRGQDIGIVCIGGICHVAFTDDPAATVNTSKGATATGEEAEIGVPLPDSASIETRLALPESDGTLYMVRQSTVNNVVLIARRLS